MSQTNNYTETFQEIDGQILYIRQIPSLPDFFTVKLWLSKSWVAWMKQWDPVGGKKYLDHAVSAVLLRNGIS